MSKGGWEQPNDNSIFLRGYPSSIEDSDVVDHLKQSMVLLYGKEPNIKEWSSLNGGLKITFQSSEEQENAFRLSHSMTIGPQQIQIIHFPGRFGDYCPALRIIFGKNYKKSIMDLSNLAEKVKEIDPKLPAVDFSNAGFVEFLFFQLGYDADEMGLPIYALNLSHNNISTVEHYDFYYPCIGAVLRAVNFDYNNLSKFPSTVYPSIRIDCDQTTQGPFKGQTTAKKGKGPKSQGSGDQDARNEWESGWDDYNSNPGKKKKDGNQNQNQTQNFWDTGKPGKQKKKNDWGGGKKKKKGDWGDSSGGDWGGGGW